MYQQQKKELLERELKHIPSFPGLMEKVKIEPVEDNKKTTKNKTPASAPASAPNVATDAGKKKSGRPKKTSTVI